MTLFNRQGLKIFNSHVFFLKKYWRCDLLKRNKKPNKTTRDTKEVRWEGITSMVKDRCAPDIESNIHIGAMWFRLHSSTDGYNDQDAYYLPLKQNKTQHNKSLIAIVCLA